MAIKFEDQAPKTTIKFEDDVVDSPIPQQNYAEDKPKKDIVGQAVEVGRQGLIGGITGGVFPEIAETTGKVIRKGEAIPGPVGRAAKYVGTGLEMAGTAMKSSRPAAFATGVVGGLTGETGGQIYESQYGPGLGAELTRLTASTLAPIPLQYLGTRAGGLAAALGTKMGIPGFSTGRTVGQLLQEQGIAAPNLSGEQRAFIQKKLDDIRGGQSSIEAEKEIVEMLKKDVARLRSTAAIDAGAIESQAAFQSKRILDDATKRADDIRARARSYSPSIRQLAEIDAKDILTKAQNQVQQLEKQTRTQISNLRQKSGELTQRSQQNIGVIKQSNLCNEIYQYTDENTTAICTLSSMVLKNFVKDGEFNHQLLYEETRKVVRALNKVVDINSYSTEKGRKGGLEQRAIAIGTQGLADVFYLMDYIFTSEEARKLNKEIFETIYFASVTESCSLCKSGEYKPYNYFNDSPMSKGVFQFDMWGLTESELSGRWNWNSLKEEVKDYGVCNSLFTAQMPVASSAKITGSYEMTEPAHSAIFNRRVVGGEIMIVNKYLINDFEKLGIWCEDLKNEIILNEGSIQGINFNNYLDPEDKQYNKKVKRIEHLIPKYKTIWEISQKALIEMAADRGPFIDQSQSMNIYMGNPTLSKILLLEKDTTL